MPATKTKPAKLSPAAFIAAVPHDARRAEAKTIVKMMQAATGEKPKMWGPSIIGFGSVHYKYATGREGDMPLLAFSPRKPATVFYGLGIAGDPAALSQLGKCTTGKGCVYVRKLADIDLKILQSILDKAARRK